jgi:4a-hydroxytetrahydrobiopterin dehydratase
VPYAEPLSDEEIAAGLALLSDWHRDGDAIVRTVTLGGFRDAIAFVNAVAAAAEAANHHPDILIHRYKRVMLTLATHATGGITQRDIDLAAAIDRLVESAGR